MNHCVIEAQPRREEAQSDDRYGLLEPRQPSSTLGPTYNYYHYLVGKIGFRLEVDALILYLEFIGPPVGTIKINLRLVKHINAETFTSRVTDLPHVCPRRCPHLDFVSSIDSSVRFLYLLCFDRLSRV